MASHYNTILQAVATAVGGSNTKVRKKLKLLEGDALPIIIIAPGREGEQINDQQFKKGVWWDYPIVAVLVTAGNQMLETGVDTYLQSRQDIRNKLFDLMGGAFDFETNSKEVVDFAASIGSNYDVAGWQCSYRNAETRTGH